MKTAIGSLSERTEGGIFFIVNYTFLAHFVLGYVFYNL